MTKLPGPMRGVMMRALFALLCLLLAAPAWACGPDSDCVVGARAYRLYLPAGLGDAPVGALLFAHGYKGTAGAEMRNKALRAMAGDLGIALVALDAGGDDWKLAHTPQDPEATKAREQGYVAAVLADLKTKVLLDPARTVLSGFSAGGMMTWTMACEMSGDFAGFVPLSGTFWAPEPATCTSPPANIVHIHGTRDATVPLAGRAIGATRQGDVAKVLAMYAGYGGYTPSETVTAPEGMTCARSTNPAGKLLEFCTFDGGHDASVARLRYGYARVTGGL